MSWITTECFLKIRIGQKMQIVNPLQHKYKESDPQLQYFALNWKKNTWFEIMTSETIDLFLWFSCLLVLTTHNFLLVLYIGRPETLECFYKTDVISKAKWLTYSVLVDLSIAGIMTSRFSNVADMTSLDVNHTGTLAASGDTSGNIRLYRYPCSLSGVSLYNGWIF